MEQNQVTILPIEQTVIVPSTTKFNKPVSREVMEGRVREVRKYLSQNYGGYTSVKGMGGYYSDKREALVNEGVVKVTGFSSKQAYLKNKKKLDKRLRYWGRKWKQESMGYEREGDLFIYDTALNSDKIEKAVKKKRSKYIA